MSMAPREAFFRAHAAHRAAVQQVEALKVATRQIVITYPHQPDGNLADGPLAATFEMMGRMLELVKASIGLEPPPPPVFRDSLGNLVQGVPKGLPK
jgi:hypothetical protein